MDIGLFLTPDGGGSDIAIVAGDIATDSTLRTAVLISLQTDRLADPDDTISDGSTNRRGWWGDAYLPPLADGSADFIGSKLWLRARSTATQATANLIQSDIEAALAWMIADGVAAAITVTTSWVSATDLAVNVAIARINAPASAPPTAFDLLWNRTLGTISPMVPWGAA